jgi:hypothetical protein
MRFEKWPNPVGMPAEYFKESPLYYQAPSSNQLISGTSIPQNTGNNYLSRTRGYVTIPQSGNYRFAISSDDASQLWIALNGQKVDRLLAAKMDQYTQPLKWDAEPTQLSVTSELFGMMSAALEMAA